ncbi:MAG: hypothetical protein M3011_09570, partial [Actinomycetota bacterium]|nr:hypothetical protein [Actinomycetota bacterium]
MYGNRLRSTIERSAAPAAVAVAIERMAERDPSIVERLTDDVALSDAVVAVTAASRSLAELCVAEPAAVEVLAALDRRPRLDGLTGVDDLAGWKRLELLRIAGRDLVGLDDLPT